MENLFKVREKGVSGGRMTKREKGEPIVRYTPSMAAQAAEMFNAFNEIWPGGFRGGIPFDEQRVREWLDNTSAVADLIAVDSDGTPVGYCGLYPHRRDAHAAYISLLGVHPKVLGKKFGKKLLLRVLEIAAEKGIQRVDLDTWSGNLRAVPLYKKVGLFWMPDTSVYMQDYIPGLFQIYLAKEWFSHHPDWYSCFKRDIAQAPDQNMVEGMEVYTYLFQAGEDRLCAEVDRYGWGFSALESVLAGKKIAVRTRLRSHKIFMGIPNAFALEIVNETGKDYTVSLLVEPFKGLKWKEPFPLSLTVQDGKSVKIEREFVVDSTAQVFKYDVASDVIKTRITLGDQSLDLVTGGKILPAVSISSQSLYTIVPPGRETHVYLDITNNTERELKGKILIFIEGAEKSYRTEQFMLSGHEVEGLEFSLATSDSARIHATPTLDMEGQCTMPTFQHSVVADGKDLATLVKGPDEKELVVLTDCMAVRIKREGGSVRVGQRFHELEGKRIDFELGPPFGISLDKSLFFDYEIVKEGSFLTIILTGDSIHLPGIRIKKYIKVAPGLHEAEFYVRLVNISHALKHVAGKVRTGEGEGIRVNPFDADRRVFTPILGTIIESDPSTAFMSENMIPQQPEQWNESWTAAQSLNRSDFSGWIWTPDNVEKIGVFAGSLHKLESTTKVVNPGEQFEPTHVWYTFSHGSLNDVRNRWNQLVGKKEIPASEQYGQLETTPPFRIDLEEPHIVERGTKSRRVLELFQATSYPLKGEIRLEVPPQWEGHFITGDKTETIPMPQPVPGGHVFLEIELSVPEDAQPLSVMQLNFKGELELDFDIPLLVVGRGEMKMHKDEGLIEVSNGFLTFDVVTDIGGNLIRLEDSQKRSFFVDNYPEIKPRFFINYNIGGIQPMVFALDQDNPFTEPERASASTVEEGLWKGVRVNWTVENQESLRGQNYTLTYLTLPGSPVVRVRLEHENPTRRRVKWAGILAADIELGGSPDNTVCRAPGGTQPWTKHRGKMPFISLPDLKNPWIRVSKEDQSLILFVPEGSPSSIMLLDLTEVVMGLMITMGETGPGGKTAAEFAFAVNQPEERIEGLRKVLKKS